MEFVITKMDVTYEISALIILIGLSGFFSGLEVALVGVSRSKVHQMLNQKLPGATALHKLKSNPSRMMASVNLGIIWLMLHLQH